MINLKRARTHRTWRESGGWCSCSRCYRGWRAPSCLCLISPTGPRWCLPDHCTAGLTTGSQPVWSWSPLSWGMAHPVDSIQETNKSVDCMKPILLLCVYDRRKWMAWISFFHLNSLLWISWTLTNLWCIQDLKKKKEKQKIAVPRIKKNILSIQRISVRHTFSETTPLQTDHLPPSSPPPPNGHHKMDG